MNCRIEDGFHNTNVTPLFLFQQSCNDPVVSSSHGLAGSGLWLDAGTNGNSALNSSQYGVWSDKSYGFGSSGGATCRNNNNSNSNTNKLEDDEKNIESKMLEISKKLASELVGDDFAT